MMPHAPTLRSLLLEGKHALSVGRVLDVTALVLAHPAKAGTLIELVWDEHPGVSNRAADVLERISRRIPLAAVPSLIPILVRWKSPLLGLMAEAARNKLRWNLALTVPRFTLTPPECRRAFASLQAYLEDRSSIVKTTAVQGLFDLALQDQQLLPTVLDQFRVLTRSGTPALRARRRKLLERLEKNSAKRRSPL
jgi:hypothetical protein